MEVHMSEDLMGQRKLPDYPFAPPEFWARQSGLEEGRQAGYQQGEEAGFQDGHQTGYQQGRQAGYQQGWSEAVKVGSEIIDSCNAAIDKGNANMLKQLEHTRRHVADKEVMARQLEEQRQLIEQFTARLDEAERINGGLTEANAELRQLVKVLRETNEQLRVENEQLDEKLQVRNQEYAALIFQHKRCLVFCNAARLSLEELTDKNDPQAEEVREVFRRKYGEVVSYSVEHGTLGAPPETDESFVKALPRTYGFIKKALGDEPVPQRQISPDEGDRSFDM
jgi:hypothetical protein